MAIDVEICLVAMHPLAHPVRQPTDGKNVAGRVKSQRIGVVQSRAGRELYL